MSTKKSKDLADQIMDSLLEGQEEPSSVLHSSRDETKKVTLEKQNHHKELNEYPDEATRFDVENRVEQGTKVGFGFQKGLMDNHQGVLKSVEPNLVQAENLHYAQNRITHLEEEMELLRKENEELASAGEAIKRRYEHLLADNENLQKKFNESQSQFQMESHMLKEGLQHKEKEIRELQIKNEDMEIRLSSDLKKIRIRERELENRLELMKMENQALVRAKDENILDLKRQMDQVNSELEKYRLKCQDLSRHIEQNQERFRRTVKTLRLALTNLESSDADIIAIKKAQ